MFRQVGIVYFFIFNVYYSWAIQDVNLEDFRGKADICFVIDDSGSIRQNNKEGEDNWDKLKSFVKTMVQNLPLDENTGAKIALIRYSSRVETIVHLNRHTSQDSLIQEIDNLPYTGGNTNTAGALRTLRSDIFTSENGDRPDARNIGVLITDGVANINTSMTLPEARLVRKNNIQLFTVGITDYVNADELKELSSDPVWYHYFLSPDFSHLNTLKDTLVSRVQEQDVPPLARCDARADIVFVLDTSGSIRQKNPTDSSYDNWDLLKRFVAYVIDSLDIGEHKTRVAVIKYSETTELVFHLDSFGKNKTALKDIVMREEYMSGGTNTSGAIWFMRTKMFKPEVGDRRDVRNVAIVITDGESTIAANMTTIEARAAKDRNIKMFAIGLTNLMDEKELKSIASEPIADHFLNSTDIAHANTLKNRLVLNLCDTNCPLKPSGVELVKYSTNASEPSQDNDQATVGEGIDSSQCQPEVKTPEICQEDQSMGWKKIDHHVIVGNNYLRLAFISSAEECQKICLQQSNCKSVEYTSVKSECAVSHVSKDEVIDSFVEDQDVEYYELFCSGGDSDIKEVPALPRDALDIPIPPTPTRSTTESTTMARTTSKPKKAKSTSNAESLSSSSSCVVLLLLSAIHQVWRNL